MLLRLGHDVREVVAHDLEVRGLAEDAVMLSSTAVKLEGCLLHDGGDGHVHDLVRVQAVASTLLSVGG